MKTTRRGFLGIFIAGLVGTVVPPKKAVAKPVKKPVTTVISRKGVVNR